MQMGAERREKIDRMRFAKDKYLSLGAGVLLAHALKELGIDTVPETAYGQNGKPYFPSMPNLHFNLSHSGTVVLCAVCDRHIGCDSEKIGTFNEKLARRFFHPTEYDMLMSETDSSVQAELFYRLWTLKESFLKATGFGLSLPLDSFSVCLKSGSIAVSQTVSEHPYGFYELSFDPAYKCACCIEDDSGATPPEQIAVSLSAL